jgi:hypothetical protein
MKPVVPKPRRCAIYRRKSTEHLECEARNGRVMSQSGSLLMPEQTFITRCHPNAVCRVSGLL